MSILGVRGQTICGAVRSMRHATYLRSHTGQMQIMIEGICGSSPHSLNETATVLATQAMEEARDVGSWVRFKKGKVTGKPLTN